MALGYSHSHFAFDFPAAWVHVAVSAVEVTDCAKQLRYGRVRDRKNRLIVRAHVCVVLNQPLELCVNAWVILKKIGAWHKRLYTRSA